MQGIENKHFSFLSNYRESMSELSDDKIVIV